MGLRPHQVRVLPTDDRWRLSPETVAAAVRADRRAGRVPFALCASAGSTNTGAVDPLNDLADVCAAEELWLHVDAAYGGFAALTAKGRALLAGAERADSVTLDPHKWLFQPMECGSVLIRDGARLERTFAIHPDYLDGNDSHGEGEVNFADRGLQLSRGFRALKIWMSVHTFGLAAFRAAIQRNLELAEFAEALVRSHAELTLMAPATLGIVCFRREWPGADEAETERRGTALIDALESTGTALVSSTRLAGRHAVRLCILNPTSSEEHVRRVIEHFAGAPAFRTGRRRQRPARSPPVPGPASWRTRTATCCAPCPCSPAWPTRRSRPSGPAASISTPPTGRRSSADGTPTGPSISSCPAGTTCRSTPARSGPPAPVTTSASSPPATGEAATATPGSPPSGAPNPAGSSKLTSEDFQWLVDTEPAVKARLAAILAERLQQR